MALKTGIQSFFSCLTQHASPQRPLPFNMNKQMGITEDHHTAYSCTIVMHTREAESGAGERKENETGGCMEGQRHG